MDTKIPLEELLYEEESSTLDFKSEQYKFALADDRQKSELLKDVLAFANSWRRVDAYILIGVKELKGGRSQPVGISEDLDDAQLQQFINSKTQRPVSFSYGTALIDGLKVGFIKIPVQRRPIYLKSDYGKLKKHIVYIRRGSSTEEATPDEVHDMGRADVVDVQDIPNLVFEFADGINRISFGESIDLDLVLLKIDAMSNIPDFCDDSRYDIMSMNVSNPSYYRELVGYYFKKKSSFPLSFSLQNNSNKTISDIKVEIVIHNNGKFLSFFHDLPKVPSSHYNRLHFTPIEKWSDLNKQSISIEKLDSYYRIEVPFEKIQPKQNLFSEDLIYIQAFKSAAFEMVVTIYADNIPEPIKKTMKINCAVAVEDGSLPAIELMHTSSKN